jgi:hypothetical protein
MKPGEAGYRVAPGPSAIDPPLSDEIFPTELIEGGGKAMKLTAQRGTTTIETKNPRGSDGPICGGGMCTIRRSGTTEDMYMIKPLHLDAREVTPNNSSLVPWKAVADKREHSTWRVAYLTNGFDQFSDTPTHIQLWFEDSERSSDGRIYLNVRRTDAKKDKNPWLRIPLEETDLQPYVFKMKDKTVTIQRPDKSDDDDVMYIVVEQENTQKTNLVAVPAPSARSS